MAEALNLTNADLVGDRRPTYTDFLKTACSENRAVVLSIEKQLVELAQAVEQVSFSSNISESKGPCTKSKR